MNKWRGSKGKKWGIKKLLFGPELLSEPEEPSPEPQCACWHHMLMDVAFGGFFKSELAQYWWYDTRDNMKWEQEAHTIYGDWQTKTIQTEKQSKERNTDFIYLRDCCYLKHQKKRGTRRETGSGSASMLQDANGAFSVPLGLIYYWFYWWFSWFRWFSVPVWKNWATKLERTKGRKMQLLLPRTCD